MRLDGPVGVGVCTCECYGIEWSGRCFAGLHCSDEGQQLETSKWMSAVCQDGRDLMCTHTGHTDGV